MLSLAIAMSSLVTVTFAPCPLPKALEKLSEATGERLLCARSLHDEVLIARLEGADKERVLREIAFSLDAKWEVTPEGRVLKPDLILRQKREADRRRETNRKLAAALADAKKTLAQLPPKLTKEHVAEYRQYLSEWERIRNESIRTGDSVDASSPGGIGGIGDPAWRALTRFIGTFTVGSLAALAPSQRVVWSERPTAMQSPFTGPMLGIASAFRREMALLDPSRPVGRARFILKSHGEASFTVQFDALNARGETVGHATETLRESAEEELEPPKPPPAPLEPEKPIVIPSESAEYFSIVNMRERTIRGALFDRWLPKLADPVRFEPTAWFPGRVLIAVAEAQKRNLIGTLSDLSEAKYSRPVAGKTPSAFLKEQYHVSLKDGWLIAKPIEHISRVSRSGARAFYVHALAQGGLDIDSTAAWITAHPQAQPGITWFGDHLTTMLSGRGPWSSLATLIDEETLGLWDNLGSSARAALRRGEELSLTDLHPAAKQRLFRALFWEDSFELDVAEITETLPNGLVAGTLSLKITEEPIVVAWSDAEGEPVQRTPLTADRLGAQIGRSEKRNVSLKHDRFRIGVSRQYALTLKFASQNLVHTIELKESFFDPKAAPVAPLPADFARRVEAARQEALRAPDFTPPVDPTPPR